MTVQQSLQDQQGHRPEEGAEAYEGSDLRPRPRPHWHGYGHWRGYGDVSPFFVPYAVPAPVPYGYPYPQHPPYPYGYPYSPYYGY